MVIVVAAVVVAVATIIVVVATVGFAERAPVLEFTLLATRAVEVGLAVHNASVI